jgi:predicted HTH transcriptional regulator
MTGDELDGLIAAGERRSVEFKSGGSLSDNHLVARVARAVLAMTNTRDGGRVIIGVEEVNATPVAKGVNAAELPSWKFDHIAAKVAAYADPYVNFELDVVNLSGTAFVVLTVEEFDQFPVICKKAFDTPPPVRTVLRRGAVYIRGRPKPESVEVANEADMRELLDFATEKQLARFVRQGVAAGVLAVGGPPAGRTDLIRYEAESKDFLA